MDTRWATTRSAARSTGRKPCIQTYRKVLPARWALALGRLAWSERASEGPRLSSPRTLRPRDVGAGAPAVPQDSDIKFHISFTLASCASCTYQASPWLHISFALAPAPLLSRNPSAPPPHPPARFTHGFCTIPQSPDRRQAYFCRKGARRVASQSCQVVFRTCLNQTGAKST